jgi:hypothetical protein
MGATQFSKQSTIIMIFAMTAGTFACGDDDDDTPDTTVTTKPAVTTAAPSGNAAEPRDPCEPVGTLVPGDFGLNDRCVEPEDGWAQAFIDSGAVWGTPCPTEPDETPQFILAVANELIVVVDPGLELSEQVSEVIGGLDGGDPDGALITAEPGEVLIDSDDFPARAQLVEITNEPAVETVLGLLDELQGAGRSVDLNYLEPVQPNNGFRPVDDPEPTTDQMPTGDAPGGALTVAVIDSTNDPSVFDTDGNRMIDEDHGHGDFVKSIIESYGVTVTLYPVGPSSGNPSVRPSPSPPGSGPGRWAPMMFEDKDIIGTLALVDPKTDVINMSLGGVACKPSGFDFGIGERLALAHAMSNMRLRKDSLQFVAAAGNNGRDVLHFPAAWRNEQAMSDIADAIELNDPAAAADVRAMSGILRDAMYAVGSLEADGRRSDFSNCGSWVNAAAFGRKQVGVYPSSQPPTTNPDAGGFPDSGAGNAKWSGTSFATANFTAALATGRVDTNDPTVFDPSTGARVTASNTGLAC